MEGMTDYLVVSAVLVIIYSFDVMAEVYRFQSHDGPTSANCYDHVTSNCVAASNIESAYICGRNVLCRKFVHEPGTTDCTQIHNNYPDRRCQAGGRNVFAKPVCSQTDYLVDGPGGVDNSQLSESSYYFAYENDPRKPLSAWYSRLSSTGFDTCAWAAGGSMYDTNQYVQVAFLQPTTISSVVLTGKDPAVNEQYVTSFKFLYSDDCLVFQEIANENGDSVILQGNTALYEIVTRHLPERVQARCFRINPQTSNEWHALRFDLKGCHEIN